MTPEQKAREAIDQRLIQSGWILQDMRQLNPMAAPGVAVREFPTSTGPVDYALFIDGIPIGVVEAKADEKSENITTAEAQSSRYARSTFKWVKTDYRIRFAYEATGKLTRFTDYKDQKYRSRRIFPWTPPGSGIARSRPSIIWRSPSVRTVPERLFRWPPAQVRRLPPSPQFIVC